MTWRVILLAVAVLGGCARLQPRESQPPNVLPPARMSADAVVLDVGFVRLPLSDEGANAAVWDEIDEQRFSPDLRRELAANGIRVGVMGKQLPKRLQEQLDAKASLSDDTSEDVEARDIEIGAGNRRLQVRPGRRSKIVASKTFPSLALLLAEDGQVRGQQLQQAQCLLALRPYPQGDSRVKLDLTPEVEHGELKSDWVGNEGSFLQRVGRPRVIIDRLRMDMVLAPGECLVLSCTPDIKGLGECFFAETASTQPSRTFLLVRVTTTQTDDLFAPERTPAALTTPAE